jgi:RNA polymerase sigma factor (sigma-70 family)
VSASPQAESYKAVLAQLRRTPADEEAWGRLFSLASPYVLASCYRYLPASRRALEGEDLAQEIWFRLSRYWHARRPPIGDGASLLSLLSVMTRRLAVDANRWRHRARRDIDRQELGPEREIVDRTAQDRYAEIELRDLLDKVCFKLSAQERQILGLLLQGYLPSEIAEQMNVSKRTVVRRLKRIRRVVWRGLGWPVLLPGPRREATTPWILSVIFPGGPYPRLSFY